MDREELIEFLTDKIMNVPCPHACFPMCTSWLDKRNKLRNEIILELYKND